MRTAIPIALSILVTLSSFGCGGDGGPYSISGSAKLPDCAEPPDFNLDGTRWYDQQGGSVLIKTAGCVKDGVQLEPGDELFSCPLTWVFSQTGSDIEILIDNEYTMKGRLCGSELHLEGGWWLWVENVEDPNQVSCIEWDDDSGEEVGIEEGGSTLIVEEVPSPFPDEPPGHLATGTLKVKGPCEADYEITLVQ